MRIDQQGNPNQSQVQELLKQLNNPVLLRAAAEQAGFKLEPREKPPEKRQIARPKIEIPEDADTTTMLQAIMKGIQDLTGYVDERLNETHGELENRFQEDKRQQLITQVNKFKKSHPDFEELLPFVNPFWQTGQYTLEEAYELGRRASGKSGKTQKSRETDESELDESRPPVTPLRAGEAGVTGDEPARKKGPLSFRDAARENLKLLIKEVGEDFTKEADDEELL